MKKIPTRQIHLDFHTSEYIENIAALYDSDEFTNMVKEAHVNSVTVFARCVHGFMYYPSLKFKEHIHPHLINHNLLSDQVQALHKAGIKAPVYIAVQWDRYTANKHPEWLIRKKDGSHEGAPFIEPGFNQSLCVNTAYYDFLVEHTIEICELLGPDLDGLFFDMVGIRPCYCAACRAEMKDLGIDMWKEEEVRRFAKTVMDRFKIQMTEAVRIYNKDCTVFYNAGHIGPCTLESRNAYTHFELESIPSGQWGYLHFPITARYARTLGKECLGMTGKFYKEWGDFHSLKNQAALEFECFRMLSYGFACSVGDQLEPTGALNKYTYRLIGKVYEQIERYEEWSMPSVPIAEAALVTSENSMYELQIPESIMGASQMLEEISLQFDIVGHDADLLRYRLVILTDDLIVEQEFQEKLDEYIDSGGSVLSCGKGGLSGDMSYPKCFSVNYVGEENIYPNFAIPKGFMAKGLESGNEYVMYFRGETILPGETGEVILEAGGPYFKREKEHFCSHIYTPSAKGPTFPAAIMGNQTILFAHPLFSIYRECAPYWCKKLIENGMDLLLKKRMIRHNGPSYLSVQILYQPDKCRYCAHLLSYVPVRKSVTIDVIEERTTLYNITMEFTLPQIISKVYSIMDEEELPVMNGKVVIPKIDGYAILELHI